MTGTVSTASKYVAQLAGRGRYHFTTEEAKAALRGTDVAVRAALRRLKHKGELADPARGFHVIVPPEYRRLGCLPPEQFVPQLMEQLGMSYYVALLSAAELHGVAPQRPQSFQVMVKTNRRPVHCGQVRVEFASRKDLERTSVVEKRTARGMVKVASREATALELVGYADHAGGLDNVASVVSELAEALDGQRLVVEARRSPIAWSQRLGYLLDVTGWSNVADQLLPLVKERASVDAAPLVRSRPRTGAERNKRWRLAANAEVQPEE